MKKTLATTLSVTMMALSGYAMIGVGSTITGMQDAEAKSGSRSGIRSSPRPSYSTPSYRKPTPAPVAPVRQAVPQNSTRAASVNPAPQAVTVKPPVKPVVSPMRKPTPSTSFNNRRNWQTTPAQRASIGSSISPLLMGAGGAIAGMMLYDWLSSPSTGAAHAATPPATNTAAAGSAVATDSGLNIIRPEAEFKVFEGKQIPDEFQKKMKANNVTVDPLVGEYTEYSKSIKTKSGIEHKVDVANEPVLVVYVKADGKPTHDLFMPLKK